MKAFAMHLPQTIASTTSQKFSHMAFYCDHFSIIYNSTFYFLPDLKA